MIVHSGLNWQLVGNSYLSALYHYTLYYLHMGYRYLEIIWSCQILYTTSTFSVMTS